MAGKQAESSLGWGDEEGRFSPKHRKNPTSPHFVPGSPTFVWKQVTLKSYILLLINRSKVMFLCFFF